VNNTSSKDTSIVWSLPCDRVVLTLPWCVDRTSVERSTAAPRLSLQMQSGFYTTAPFSMEVRCQPGFMMHLVSNEAAFS